MKINYFVHMKLKFENPDWARNQEFMLTRWGFDHALFFGAFLTIVFIIKRPIGCFGQMCNKTHVTINQTSANSGDTTCLSQIGIISKHSFHPDQKDCNF